MAVDDKFKFKDVKDAEFHGMATNLFMIGNWEEEQIVELDNEVLSPAYMESDDYRIEIAMRRSGREMLVREQAEKLRQKQEREEAAKREKKRGQNR